MAHIDSLYPDDWKTVARKDWARVRVMLDAEDIEGAAYFLQQSIEKYLKAWLLERGWPLKKTHELVTLLTEACNFEPTLVNHESVCDRLAGYYFSQRYPSLIEAQLSESDVQTDIAEARALLSDLFPGEPA